MPKRTVRATSTRTEAERPRQGESVNSPRARSTVLPPPHRLSELDSHSLDRLVAKRPLLILPVGALEAHGPHLPLGADLLQAEATADSLAERLDALVAPGLAYGVCPGTRRFPGSVSRSLEGLSREVREILGEFRRQGFRRVLVLSGHGEPGPMAALREGARRAAEDHPGLAVAALCDYEFVYELRGTLAPADDGHGGLLETSRVLALAPGQVGRERPRAASRHPRSRVAPLDPAEWPESVQGDTAQASEELGRTIQEHVLARLLKTVQEALPPAGGD